MLYSIEHGLVRKRSYVCREISWVYAIFRHLPIYRNIKITRTGSLFKMMKKENRQKEKKWRWTKYTVKVKKKKTKKAENDGKLSNNKAIRQQTITWAAPKHILLLFFFFLENLFVSRFLNRLFFIGWMRFYLFVLNFNWSNCPQF